MNRRSFMKGILALGIAPSVVKAENLMRISSPKIILYGDGIHDDTHALQTWIDGGRVLRPDGSVAGIQMIGEEFKISETIILNNGTEKIITNSYFHFHNENTNCIISTGWWKLSL